MKLNEIIILNILVLGLNLIFIGDNSLMGVINLFTGFYITVGSIIITILSVIKRDKKSIIIYFSGMMFFIMAAYLYSEAFDKADATSYSELSSWYKFGPGIFYSLGILISLNLYFILNKKDNKK